MPAKKSKATALSKSKTKKTKKPRTDMRTNKSNTTSVKTTSLEDLIVKVSESKVTARNPGTFHTFTDILSESDTFAPTTNLSTFLTIEPYFAFAYWEITPQAMIEAASKVGPDAKLILRFYDITESNDLTAARQWDFEVFDRVGNWYLKLEHAKQRLHLQVGVKSSSRAFWPIMSSDIMHMPKQALSGPAPLKWFVTDNSNEQEFVDANTDVLKKTLGPYFYDLLMRGRFDSVVDSSMEAIFHSIEKL